MRSPVRLSRGLTLIEAMTVVAVVAILAALAAPSFTNLLQSRRVSGAASLLVSDLQNARSEAVSRNASVAVSFSSSGYAVTSGGSTLRSVNWGDGTQITSGSSLVIAYDPRWGSATSVGSVTLGQGSNSLQIGVNMMGRVRCETVSGTAKC